MGRSWTTPPAILAFLVMPWSRQLSVKGKLVTFVWPRGQDRDGPAAMIGLAKARLGSFRLSGVGWVRSGVSPISQTVCRTTWPVLTGQSASVTRGTILSPSSRPTSGTDPQALACSGMVTSQEGFWACCGMQGHT
jgi:hypothetical protein